MDLKRCLSGNYLKNSKTVIVVGADSSIGEALVPELMEEYESVVLTESPANYLHLVEKYMCLLFLYFYFKSGRLVYNREQSQQRYTGKER